MAEGNAKEVIGDQIFALPSPAGLFFYNNFPDGEDNSEKNTFVHPARLRKIILHHVEWTRGSLLIIPWHAGGQNRCKSHSVCGTFHFRSGNHRRISDSQLWSRSGASGGDRIGRRCGYELLHQGDQ